jgi:hypothetical protein
MAEQWEVILLTEVEDWYLDLCKRDPDTAAKVEQAVEMLADEGPTLGRPFGDKIAGSKHHKMKELRPTRSDTHIRILFVFDPLRQAILLVAGDKAGNWKQWYEANIPVAEQRYDAWLDQQRKEQTDG